MSKSLIDGKAVGRCAVWVLIVQGHRYRYHVILNSCGSIHPIIPRLIDADVNCLHSLQALAAFE